MNIKSCTFIFLALISICACSQNKIVSNSQTSLRDSVLIYKKQGLQELIKVADYWGDDTESYWAFEQADSILNSITEYSKYEESLASIYTATSYVFYGLSYVPSVLEASRQYNTQEQESFPKVGVKESGEIIIRDSKLPQNDTLFNVSRLEFRALYSMLYFYKAINLEKFEERLLHNYDRSMAYEELYSQWEAKLAYRISSILNMQAWYNYIVTCAQIAYWENNGQAADIKVMPWKEFIDLALWHDSLIKDIEQYEDMDDETFHRIEVKAAYAQYIMLSHIAKNLGELKGK
jgi:hypothetical protein